MSEQSGQVKDLVAVLEISRSLVLHQDLQTLVGQIEQAAVAIMRCERATVFVFDEIAGELYSLWRDRSEKIRVPAASGIAGCCFTTGAVLNVPDAYRDERFNKKIDKQTGFKTRTILAAPLFGDRGNVLGVLEVLNKSGGAFGKWDEFLLDILSAQCGIAIHRQTLMEDIAERKRLQHELAIAREIQKSLLPKSMPEITGYDIAGWSQSAEETGGDFYDFHINVAGDLLTILADVSGHGVGPALLAAECCALQRAVFTLVGDYRSSLNQLNQMLCRHIPSDRFITAFAAYLSTGEHKLSFLSAGHGPVFVLRTGENRIDTLPVASLPLGIMADADFDQWQTLPFNTGDILAVFTDGFFEGQDLAGNNFGADRIAATLFHHAGLPAAELIDRVYRDLSAFTAGTRQQDDLTAVIVKRLC